MYTSPSLSLLPQRNGCKQKNKQQKQATKASNKASNKASKQKNKQQSKQKPDHLPLTSMDSCWKGGHPIVSNMASRNMNSLPSTSSLRTVSSLVGIRGGV